MTHWPTPLAALVLGALVCGCDQGDTAQNLDDAGVNVAAVLACSLPASPPSMGSCIASGTGDAGVALACNPVTNVPCASGEACDATSDSMGNITGFACYAGPNTAKLCALCSVENGPTCAGGLSCALVTSPWSACARFCCTNEDCGDAGVCVTADSMGRSLFGAVAPSAGLCAAM